MPQPSFDPTAFASPDLTLAGPAPVPAGTLARLLGQLAEAPTLTPGNRQLQDRLINARLGVASSLFAALRAKHSPTAQHCLRVALRCSTFGKFLQLNETQLDHLEVGALLHDIGKIGVPDYILTKAGELNEAEVELMSMHRQHGFEILSACVGADEVLRIVTGALMRYDGRGQEPPVVMHDDLPLGARILAIADAYDAMTTEHVYRAAMPRERALAELFEHAGTQFDPELVRHFAQLSSQAEAEINQIISQRWTNSSQSSPADTLWQVRRPLLSEGTSPTSSWLFQQRLLDAMHDAVIFIDARRQVVLWNRGAERLSGVSRESVFEKAWSCQILDFRDPEGNLIRDTHCPVEHVILTGVQTLRRVTLTPVRGDRVTVDMHVFPVMDHQRRCYGATVLLHDVSSEMTLERRVQNLHERATTDPLTGVSNRAEFDRVHAERVTSSLRTGVPFSIVICDIDRFKLINDVFGHQAGDEALISFASLLRHYTGEGDLLARFGGEEFVMVWPDCDNATATRRAEEIRFDLSRIPQPMLNQKMITASFGVTEVQPGDTPETMLRRADRALYQAKDGGRNRVVQLGAGIDVGQEGARRSWLTWLQRRPPDCLVQKSLIVNVPLNLLVEKVKGFISDQGAEIISIEDNYIVLGVDGATELQRRRSDRPQSLVLELKLREVERGASQRAQSQTRTIVDVTVRPRRARDRRKPAEEQANQIVVSLKAYLIAQNYFGD